MTDARPQTVAVRVQPRSDIQRRWLRSILGAGTPMLASLAFVAVLLLAVVAPGLLARYDPNEIHPADSLNGPSAHYWLGTDELGRDVWSRLVHGSRLVMLISVAAIGLSMVLGIPMGLVAGAYGGWLDMVIMRFQDGLLAFPSILFAVLMVSALGPSLVTLIAVMALVYVPRFARLVRGSVLIIKTQDYVLASHMIGASMGRIMFRAILPNTLAPVFVQATIGLAFTILTEASLSYLGMGVQPPTATWGTILQGSQRYSHLAPWYVLAPGVCIFLTVLVFNFLGDRLRDSLDPRLRGAG